MVSTTFARILAAGRPQFNRRAAAARRRLPALDFAAFADFLAQGVDGMVVAAAAIDADRAPQVALAAFDMALELVGQGMAGPQARSAMLGRVWRELVPQLAGLLVLQPVLLLGMLSNAMLNLEKHASVRTVQWLDQMVALAQRVDSLDQLRAVGQVQAWRAGMAHFRHGAMAAAGTLPEPLALAAFGVAPGTLAWDEVERRLLAEPWWRPDRADHAAADGIEVGSFDGFGGAFGCPPLARASGDGFLVKSADRYSLLVADAFGAILQGASAEEFDAATHLPAEEGILDGAQLRIAGRVLPLDLPADGLALSFSADAVAITSPYTHAVRLVPLR